MVFAVADVITDQSSLGLVEWHHMSTRFVVSSRVPEEWLDVSPSFVHDNESDIPRSEPIPARAPHGTDNLLRVFGDPRNGFPG